MSFLLENNSENIAARITHKGRQKIAQGNFNIEYFQIGDSEFDYAFSEFDGVFNYAQKVMMPFDKDNQVKYPYKVSSTDPTLTGVTYGTPIQSSYTNPVENTMNPAGFVSGVTIESEYDLISTGDITPGATSFIISTDFFAALTGETDNFITLALTTLDGVDAITEESTSFVYRVLDPVTGTTIYVDRPFPDLSSITSNITVIKNGYYPHCLDVCNQHDSWALNIVWNQYYTGSTHQGIAGLSPADDENLSGYTSNVFVSTKEFFGYNTSLGQTYNTGTTITDSLGDVISVSPEEQHSLAILRYPRDVDVYAEHDLGFKYEDYIADSTNGEDYFKVNIPFILYDRKPLTDVTIGAEFVMSGDTKYINSYAIDTKIDQIKYRDLADTNGNVVGKVFTNQKLIVFDDQEIIAALDNKSNRRYTLPIPRISAVPVDSKCDVQGDITSPLLSPGETVYVSYLLAYTGGTGLTGLHCNHYGKVDYTGVNSDVSLTFGDDAFRYMTTGVTDTLGYVADKFFILAQQVDTGEQPDPTNWKIMDFTNEFTLVGGVIDPNDLRGTRFIISDYDYENPYGVYDLEEWLGDLPGSVTGTTLPQFGDEQPFPGEIDVVRGYDIEVMNYFVNLPSGQFDTSQNPTEPLRGSDPLRITEVALLDSNKDVLVIGKTSSPIMRTGTQVVAVKIDI